jgi:hypothetical protein
LCALPSAPLDVSIIIQDELKQEQVRYNLRNAWPSKWVGPDLKSGASEMAIEQLEIAHEGVTLGAGRAPLARSFSRWFGTSVFAGNRLGAAGPDG